MRGTIAAVAAATVLAGCGGNTDTTATKMLTTSATPTAARPGQVPGGWGDVRPDSQAIQAMAQWAQRSRVMAIIANTTEATSAMDNVRSAVNDGDVSAMKSACQEVREQLTIPLAAQIPTPDPDLTHALQSVIADAETFATKCNALPDTERSSDLQSLWEALSTVWNDMVTLDTIMDRDQRIIEGANR
jgi:hypothetical protein